MYLKPILRASSVLLLGFTVAVSAQSGSSHAEIRLTQDQALDAARRHILAKEEKARPADLTDYSIVPLDAQTWGKNYWAFQFSKHGNSQYHVSKESGSVQEILVLPVDRTQTGGGYSFTDGSVTRDMSPRVPMPTLMKMERWSDYLITITFPQALAGKREEVGFGCQLWEVSENVRPFHHQEFKEVLVLKSVNHVRTLTLTITKSDAERFPIIDCYLITPNSGTHISPRITDIPTE